MDSFKAGEVARMEKGGNQRWREFWEAQAEKTWSFPGKGGDNASKARVEDVYGGDIGGEWKERLACDVEGREFTGYTTMPKAAPRTGSDFGGRSQKDLNEEFFAKKGAANAGRSDGLRPSEGGKYAGFGSEPVPSKAEPRPQDNAAMPGMDDFQKDPVAALSKGLGWFTGAAVKSAKTVNTTWIQPTAQKVKRHQLR